MKIYKTTDTQKAIVSLLVFILLLSGQVLAQVSIAPTSLFFDSQSRFSSLTVSNGGQQAQEVSISTEFGYPTTRDGRLAIVHDSTLAEDKSIADWIKIFPQDFTLQPQQRQTVRFIARPPGNLQDGGYWSRVKIQSNPVSPPIESVEEGQVGAQINLVVNQVIAAHYHTPNAHTDVEVTEVTFTQDDNNENGQIAVSMEQTGNAPFMGSISLSVTDESGDTVYRTTTTNSVYTSITRVFNMNLTDVEPGTYTISGEVTSKRRDISQDKLLQIEPVSFVKKVTIE